jgi:multidrug resistance efflux pump
VEVAQFVDVSVAKATRETISAPVSAVGTIFPREQAAVAAKISAQIKQMGLLKNKLVRAGEVIAVLESRDLVAQRNEAVAALNQERASERSVTTGTIPQTNAQDQKALRDAQVKVATMRATYERRLALYQKGGISKKDLESSQMDLTTAENELRLAEQTVVLRAQSLNPNDRALAAARVQAAQQRVATLDAQLGYATIRAPITGIVTDQFQYEGEFAAAGGKLVNIADISEVIVKAPFADTVAAQLKVGDVARVLPTDTTGQEMTGKVTLISRSSDPLNRSVEVWVTLGNGAGRLRANGAAQVTAATLRARRWSFPHLPLRSKPAMQMKER